MEKLIVRAVAFIGGAIFCIALLTWMFSKPRGGNTLEAECSSNLKTIAAAMIVYSNSHNGKYPDSMEELFAASAMTSAIFICPASNDTQATGTQAEQAAAISAGGHQEQAAALSTGGHLSYIYLGKGVTSSSPDDTVLVYEPLANHHGRGMNVLFNDYHVSFLSAAEGQKLIDSIVSGKPTRWPPPVAK